MEKLRESKFDKAFRNHHKGQYLFKEIEKMARELRETHLEFERQLQTAPEEIPLLFNHLEKIVQCLSLAQTALDMTGLKPKKTTLPYQIRKLDDTDLDGCINELKR